MRWIRPVISLIGICSLIVAGFLRLVAWEVIVPLIAVTVTYWFKARDEEKQAK